MRAAQRPSLEMIRAPDLSGRVDSRQEVRVRCGHLAMMVITAPMRACITEFTMRQKRMAVESWGKRRPDDVRSVRITQGRNKCDTQDEEDGSKHPTDERVFDLPYQEHQYNDNHQATDSSHNISSGAHNSPKLFAV
ncbi:hypothetical protein OHB06_26915 [Streptomyces sp. NBC_01604]|uniref:hypothetical protein n=1 Tax=Streptomyces sp. NBC_01604 TaxID=2975894 RepID=UPI00386B1032